MAFFAFLRAFLLCAVLLCVTDVDAQRVRGSVQGVRTTYSRPATTRYTGTNAYAGTYQNTGVNQNQYYQPSTVYRAPTVYSPAVQTGYYPQTIANQQTTSMITTAACDATWTKALLAMMTNYDDWKCSSRTFDTGAVQACVITGPLNVNTTNPYIYSGCGWIMPYFCDDSVRDLVSSMIGTQQAAAAPVPAGYTLVAGSGYYKVHPESLTWSQAKAACEAEGTRLATPVTGTDYSNLWSYVNSVLSVSQMSNGVWLGFNDLAYEGDFRTVTGQPTCMFGALPFMSGQPDGGTGENCLQFGLSQEPTFNDYPCGSTLPFVCEQTLSTRNTVCRQSPSSG